MKELESLTDQFLFGKHVESIKNGARESSTETALKGIAESQMDCKMSKTDYWNNDIFFFLITDSMHTNPKSMTHRHPIVFGWSLSSDAYIVKGCVHPRIRKVL